MRALVRLVMQKSVYMYTNWAHAQVADVQILARISALQVASHVQVVVLDDARDDVSRGNAGSAFSRNKPVKTNTCGWSSKKPANRDNHSHALVFDPLVDVLFTASAVRKIVVRDEVNLV